MTLIMMPIGGNENDKKPVVSKEFIRLAGGDKASIVVLPQPSVLVDTPEYYIQHFLKLGAQTVRSLDFRSRLETQSDEYLEAIQQATGIFISGGTQMRLPAIIGGTKLEAAIFDAYQRGVIIAGTSAGASVMSKVMVAYGKSGSTPREGLAQFTPGLGLTDKIIFDQHFRQRDRLGRLIYAISAHPGLLGVGIDENTAAIVEDEAKITVVGTGAITVVDGSELESTDVAEAEKGKPVAVSNLRVHVLTAGCSYHIPTRKAHIPNLQLVRE
ncbi:MAG: cyanophycinase [Anaerolineales bacterium]